ncbi:barstar family protein [Paralysiella testudinis]|uniref:Barstar family protein n=1 Tax=Paralysiella testudinis TaxID=2809020 RepID=A0A892ZID6_9NEIS|nr:barstar family protein [Paralysiella testudinis]QRQ82208.1 barstar family protein [Paralysiella testudinis]
MRENINKLYLDGESIQTKADFHKKIGDLLNAKNFIDGYGYNLDALWDILSSGAGLNCVLHWENSEISKQNLGEEHFYAIVDILKMAENVTWTEDYVPFKLCLE